MEQKQVKVKASSKDEEIKISKLFKWKIEKEEKVDDFVVFSYKRDVDENKAIELNKLEKEYRSINHIGAMWPFYVLIAITFIMLTLLLVFSIVNKGQTYEKRLPILLGFGIPSLVFMISSVVYFFVVINKISKDTEKGQTRLNEIEKIVKD